jgi:hypothetical protein
MIHGTSNVKYIIYFNKSMIVKFLFLHLSTHVRFLVSQAVKLQHIVLNNSKLESKLITSGVSYCVHLILLK